MSRTSVPLQEENDKDRKSKGRPSKKPQTKATRKPTKNRETVIDEFLTKAKTLYADGPNEENVNALFDEYDSIGRETEKKGKGSKTNDECVLISLIKHSKWRLEEDEDLLKRFLRRILSKWPHLVVEKADIPPLIWGLRRRCGLLVDSILDMNDASYALEKTFWDQNHGNESCLHIAIRRGSPSSQIELLTSRLCERYPDVLLKTNRHGNTPLHELVGRIGEEVDPEKLEAEYRIWQEIQELKKATKKNTDNKTKGGRNDLLDSTKEEVGKTDNAEEVEEAEEAEQEGEREGAGEVEEDGEDDDEDDEDEEYTELSQDCRCAIIKMMIGRAQKQIERTNVLLATKNNESRTSYQKRIERLNEVLKRLTWFNKLNSSTQEQFYREIVAKDPIARVIREYCMRELPSSEIVNCLYTPSTELCSERQIDFDLSGLPGSSISARFLEGLRLQLRFESILKYVALPKLTVGQTAGLASQQNDPVLKHKAPSDLTQIFEWLKTNGVKKVVRISVLDYGDCPHPDSVIEKALASLDVEIWEWKKVDLCSDVIANSSKVVRQISLYLSGNPAVLMGWGSAQSFANRTKFPNLETIDLFVKEADDDDENERLKALVGDFCDSLKGPGHIKQQASSLLMSLRSLFAFCATKDIGIKENLNQRQKTLEEVLDPENLCKDMKKKTIQEACGISVHAHYQKGDFTYATDFIGAEEIRKEEVPWLESIGKFKTFLRNIRSSAPRVKIAIIDDGIDMSNPQFRSRTIVGKSFSPYPNSKDFMRSYFVPSGVHGTQMAILVDKICPSPQLFIARLDEHDSVKGYGRRITPKSAAEAIEWACQCKVDIISMSWTVESHGQEPADINRLETAIHEAHKQKILMFCSTSDRGITGDKSYPGRLSECFEIGGADLNGEKLIWVDPEVNYLFPGKRIPFNNDDGKTYSVLEDSAKDSLRKKETMTTMLNSLKAEKGGKFIDIKAKIVKAFITKLKFKDETTYRDVTAETIDKVDWNEDSEWALSAVMGPSQVSEED